MDPFVSGRDLAVPGVKRKFFSEDIRESLSRPLPFVRFFQKFTRISLDNYVTPLSYRVQWFPWADAFPSLASQRRVLQIHLAAATEEDLAIEEYGSTTQELFSIKRMGLGQSTWSVESVSNQWWGMNVICSVFTFENGVPGRTIDNITLADEFSLVSTSRVCLNYVGNSDVSPLSYGELAIFLQATSTSQSQSRNLIESLTEEDNFELLDLRGGKWTEIMYGTRGPGGAIIQPAPQLRDVPTSICTGLTPKIFGSFYSYEKLQKKTFQMSMMSFRESLKYLHSLQSTFHEGAERLCYPSIGVSDSKKRIIALSKWDSEDCFQLTQPTARTILVGIEDTSISSFDTSGILAYVTRFSVTALLITKLEAPLHFYGAFALKSKRSDQQDESDDCTNDGSNCINEGKLKETVSLADDLPTSLATKFLLFPTAMLSRLLNGDRLDKAQAWWVSASLESIVESIFQHEPTSAVRNVIHFNEEEIEKSEDIQCQFLTIASSVFIPSKCVMDWGKWDTLFMHDGCVDLETLMKGLEDSNSSSSLPHRRVIIKSLNGQKFSHDPISSVQVDEQSECEKTVEYMPSWAENCIGMVYSLWRHLIVCYPFRVLRGSGVQIGTAWKSAPVKRPTWKRLSAALKECLDEPWEMKNASHLGIAFHMLEEMGSDLLSQSILTAMVIYGEIRLVGPQKCLSNHLLKKVGFKVQTSIENGPEIPEKCLRAVKRSDSAKCDLWISVTPNQWLGPFKEIDGRTIHGDDPRVLPPLNVIVEGMDIISFTIPHTESGIYKVGSSSLYVEEVVRLHLNELKVSVYCGEHVRGIEVNCGNLLLVLDKERMKSAELAAELGFNLNLVKGKIKGKYMPATFGKIVNNQRALENTIENIQRRRGLEVSSRAIASAIILHFTLFGNLKVSSASPHKVWVPAECQINENNGFVLNHNIKVSGRTRVHQDNNNLMIGLTATSSLDLVHEHLNSSASNESHLEPITLSVISSKISRYSTGTSPVVSWPSVGLPGYLV